MNKRIKKKQIKMKNKKLCKRYPFLIPRNRWTGKIAWVKRGKCKDWHWHQRYAYTELDLMPDGWRKVFGEQMCEEIRKVLIKVDYLYDYRIADIKSKWAELRWYSFGAPKEVYEIIHKYTELSRCTCIRCGRPATKLSCGWIDPYCDKCVERLSKDNDYWEFTDLEEENGY